MCTYTDKKLMQLAINEHFKCTEFPKVGSIIAKDGQIIASGYRGESTSTHAERVAIEKLEISECQGSTLYTTLEPCVDIRKDQNVKSCTDLIIASGIREVVIGVLDSNGDVYTQGYKKLLENSIKVRFFNRNMRSDIELSTFKYDELHKVVGNEKRRFPVVASGIKIDVQFSDSDSRTIQISFSNLQFAHECVDLVDNSGAVRMANGARKFSDVTDPDVFRFPRHYARMKKGTIAIIKPAESTFCVLVQLKDLFINDIEVQFEVRNLK